MKAKKVVIKAYYNLGEEYILFPDNPLHNKTYENVNVEIKEATRKICNIDFIFDVVEIEGEEPIDCELVGTQINPDGTLVIKICEDWG